MKPADRLALFERFAAANPEPTTELEFNTPFELLAAVLLSAQATDKGVNAVTRRLFPVANTPQAIVGLGVDKLSEAIRTLGLYRNKAKHLMKTCEILLQKHQGQVPADRASLESLPGVGRKTANVLLNTAFGEPTIAVDTHIFRVSNRLGLARGLTPEEVERKLNKATPPAYRQNAHHWLLLHGRYVCKARRPECWRCLVSDLCSYRPKSLPPPAGSMLDAPPRVDEARVDVQSHADV
ncbi:MAG: endonuclease III [Lautropia sp.]|nr:endonuclease III [Lautropia sp.]